MTLLHAAQPRALYTSAEACALIGISDRTLRRYVAAGLIRQSFIRGTMRPRYLGSDINKFLQII